MPWVEERKAGSLGKSLLFWLQSSPVSRDITKEPAELLHALRPWAATSLPPAPQA